MIRPITIVTFLMACGSGLYLYQSKHEVQLLDRTIEKTLHDTGALREQSRLLATEWNMLNDPERLRQFSDTYLSLKSINPAQYTSLNDLGSRLPAPQIEAPPAAEAPLTLLSTAAPAAPLAGDDAAQAAAETEAAAGGEALPVPPIPLVRPAPAVTPAAHPIEARIAMSRPVAVAPVSSDARPADVRSAEPRQADVHAVEPKAQPRVTEARPEVRAQAAAPPRPIVLAAPRPQPAYSQPAQVAVSSPGPAQAPVPFRQPVQVAPVKFAPVKFAPVQAAPVQAAPTQAAQAPAPFSGSLLGMARRSMPPAPRPVPVSATYNAN